MSEAVPSVRPTRRRRALASASVLTAGVCVAGVVAASPADAHPQQLHVTKVLSSSFVGPLQFAVSGRTFVVADAFTSTLATLNGTPLAHGPSPATGGDVGGVAINRARGEIAYTTSNGDHSRTTLTVLRHGKKVQVVNLAAFERKYNPDHIRTYGVAHPSSCVRKALTAANVPVHYRGAIDSHPYAVASLGRGVWAVADAGGNDILRVDARGRISVLSVLPAQRFTITKAFAAQNHLSNCVVGVKYYVEGVPTDVEASGSKLYVSTLPGADAPHRGRVYSIDRRTHHRVFLGSGLNMATNLAVTPGGRIFVAELGSGRISQLVHGRPVAVASVPGVVGLEYTNGHLYASTAPAVTGGGGPGQIVQLGS